MTESLPRPAEPLVVTSVFEFDESRPRYVRRMKDGNVAYHGFLLLHDSSAARVEFLLDSRRGSLWEFGFGKGVTAADSALVLEGLMACGVSLDELRDSFQELVEKYYDADEGAFRTVLMGRSAYWRGACADTTAHLGFLLQQADVDSYAPVIEACANYVRSVQGQNGRWSSKWYPSFAVPSYHAVRFLCQQNVGGAELLRWADQAIAAQIGDGSWSHSVIDTAATLLSLRELSVENEEMVSAIERGVRWLRARGSLSTGEMILYYWFSHQIGKAQLEKQTSRRLFFSSIDNGSITETWRQLALTNEP